MEEDIKIAGNIKKECYEASECALAGGNEAKKWKREAQAIENILKELEKKNKIIAAAIEYIEENKTVKIITTENTINIKSIEPEELLKILKGK